MFPFEGSSVTAMAYLKTESLGAMEIEFVRGVHMSDETARKARAESEKNGISLSCHGPYWINCAAKEQVKLNNSIRNLMETVRAAHTLGAKVIVFHPAFYLGRSKEETMKITINTLKQVEEKMLAEGIKDVFLGAETGGKTTQLGGLEETIELASQLKMVKPVVDFAHLHARGNGWIKGKPQYAEVFEKIEKSLGRKAVESFHSHFSEIIYGEFGEKSHAGIGSLPKHSPDFEPLAQLLADNGYAGTIICETPMLDLDAKKMQRSYLAKLGK